MYMRNQCVSRCGYKTRTEGYVALRGFPVEGIAFGADEHASSLGCALRQKYLSATLNRFPSSPNPWLTLPTSNTMLCRHWHDKRPIRHRSTRLSCGFCSRLSPTPTSYPRASSRTKISSASSTRISSNMLRGFVLHYPISVKGERPMAHRLCRISSFRYLHRLVVAENPIR